MTTNDDDAYPTTSTKTKTRNGTDTSNSTSKKQTTTTTRTLPATSTSIATLTKSQIQKLQSFSKENERNYTIGVMAVITTAAMTIRFPAYYWIWHFLRTIFYLPVRYYRFQKHGWELYLLDWCYAVTYMTIAGIILALLRIQFGIQTPLEQFNDELIKMAFAMCCGPLIWSVYVFRNSIVFHDVDYMTSVFIHLSPFTLMWCLRWGAGTPSVIDNDTTLFPHMFHVCASPEEYAAADACLESLKGSMWCNACSAPFVDFVIPPALLYLCVWAIPYFYFICVRWNTWIIETKRETLITYFVQTNPKLNKVLENNLMGVFGISKKYASPLGYMLFHFLLVVLTASTSYFLWHSFFLHTVVFFLALWTAVHNGSQYMFRVFAYRYADGELKKHQTLLE